MNQSPTIANPLKSDSDIRMNIGPELFTINVDGISLRVEVSGNPDTPIVLLLHGWGCSLETVRSIASVAAETHRVFNIDLPGFGQSTEPASVWGVEEYTKLIEGLVRQLNINNPSLIGHSFGGRISILYSSRNPVDKVILVDAAGIKPRRPLKYYLRVYSFKTMKWIAKTFLPPSKADKFIESRRNRHGSPDYNSASPRMKAILSRVVNEDLRNVMPNIKAPTLLIWGENDTATPLSDAKQMEKLIPEAGLVSFPGVGHYSFLENPRGFRAVLSSFLKS